MSRRRAAVLGLLLAAASPAAAEAPLRLGLPEVPARLDPHRAVTRAEHVLARELFPGLVALDAAGGLAPGLAESWTVSADGLVYVFTLKPALAWSDGRPLEARDVVKSIERALDPATAAPFAAQLFTIRNAEPFRLGTLSGEATLGVTARDRRTVEFRLAAPSQRFLQVLAQPVAAPVPLHRIAALKDDWDLPDRAVASGPFVAAAAEQGYVLRRNPAAAPAPAVAEVRLRAYDSGAAAAAAIARDDLDLALGFTPAPPPRRAGGRARAAEAEAAYQLLVNVTRAPLDRREVRHALGMVIDRAELVRALKLDGAVPAYSPVVAPPYAPYRAPYARLDRDDRQVVARALLLDLDTARTPPLRFAVPEGPGHRALAEAVAGAWRGLGFAVALTVRAETEHERAVLAGDFDIAVAVPWAQAATLDAQLMRFTQAAGPWNAARYRELDFETFMTAADGEITAEFQQGQLREAEGVLIEDQVVWPVLQWPAAVIRGDAIAGAAANTAGLHPLGLLVVQR